MMRDPLLAAAMTEGFADFIAQLVTGNAPDLERDRWARVREAAIWDAFQTDRVRLLQYV